MAGKKIALFGGSFNPPHEGHFAMGRYLHEALKVDEVWFLFTKNWQKDPAKYAPLEDRMAMARIMARHYPGEPFVMSDIEEELGTHITCDVLKGLKTRFPDHRFIWTMGADNLATFHTWEHFDTIIENFPIAVVNRPPYSASALQSYTALTYAHLKIDDPAALADRSSGWCFLDKMQQEMSSTNLLARLHAGCRTFDGPFQDIADYIVDHGLYDLGANPGQPVNFHRGTGPSDKLDLK